MEGHASSTPSVDGDKSVDDAPTTAANEVKPLDTIADDAGTGADAAAVKRKKKKKKKTKKPAGTGEPKQASSEKSTEAAVHLLGTS